MTSRAQADRLEDLRAGVGGDGGHAHLGHDLQHALAERLDQVAAAALVARCSAASSPRCDQVRDRLDRQVGVDGGGAVADQQRHVVAPRGRRRHSTTRPTRVRVFSRIRWWWTAPVSSSDGIGARASRSAPRSDSTMMPGAVARSRSSTSAQISSSRRAAPRRRRSTSYRPRRRARRSRAGRRRR